MTTWSVDGGASRNQRIDTLHQIAAVVARVVLSSDCSNNAWNIFIMKGDSQ